MEKKERTMRQMRSVVSEFKTREEGDAKIIEGYFAVFDSVYQITPDMSESIAPGAFSNTLKGDIRALIDHESMFVLGRTTAKTLILHEDKNGLWGTIIINENDQDAMNLWHRVKRGDVNQCSFGFDIENEETELLKNGGIHWTITRVKLYEVSVCTFPAYEETAIEARKKERAQMEKREREKINEQWRADMRNRLRSISDGRKKPRYLN